MVSVHPVVHLHELRAHFPLRSRNEVPRFQVDRGPAVSPLDGVPSKHCAMLDLSRGLRVDRTDPVILPLDLYDVLGTPSAPLVVDVRSPDDVHVHRPAAVIQEVRRG